MADAAYSGGATPGAISGAAPTGSALTGLKYICGDCGAVNYIRVGDFIRCRECGHRVLYKARTKRLVEVEAR